MQNVTDMLISVGIVCGAIALGVGLHFVLSSVLSWRHARKPFSLKGVPLNIQYWSGPLSLILPAICVALTIPFLQFPESWSQILKQVLTLWFIGAFAWLVVRTIAIFREIILSRFNIETSDNLEARRVSTQIKVFERVLISIVVVCTIALMLMTFQTVRQIGVSILASAGVIGLVIGFAAQKSIATILAGLQIAITQPIRIEDVVVLEGEFGRIEEITLTFVVVRLWDQRRLVVPITQFIEKPFQNWTRTTAELIGTVFIHADYDVPVDEVRAEVRRVVEESDFWDGRVCKLQVTDVTSDGLELRVLASAANAADAFDLRCHIREQILEFVKNRFPESLPRTRINLDHIARNAQLLSVDSGAHQEA